MSERRWSVAEINAYGRNQVLPRRGETPAPVASPPANETDHEKWLRQVKEQEAERLRQFRTGQ